MKIFTIGHTKKNLEKFIHLLQKAEVDAVIDIRINNTSQLAGYAKRDDLQFILETSFGIRYAHVPELAPTKGLLDSYRKNKDWGSYEQEFGQLLRERRADVIAVGVMSGFERPCLLCSEDRPDKCHRRLVAEYVAACIEGVEVNHLW